MDNAKVIWSVIAVSAILVLFQNCASEDMMSATNEEFNPLSPEVTTKKDLTMNFDRVSDFSPVLASESRYFKASYEQKDPVVVEGRLYTGAFMNDGSGNLRVMDFSDVTRPKLNFFGGSGYIESSPALYKDKYLLATRKLAGETYLSVFEINAQPVPFKTHEIKIGERGRAAKIHVEGDIIYLFSDTVDIFDFTDISQPKFVGSFLNGKIEANFSTRVQAGQYIVGRYNNVLFIDVSNWQDIKIIPLADAFAKQLNCLQDVHWDIKSKDGVIYITSRNHGLIAFKMQKGVPVKIGQLVKEGLTGFSLHLAGHLAFLGTDKEGLKIIDISDPASMKVIQSIQPRSSGSGMGDSLMPTIVNRHLFFFNQDVMKAVIYDIGL